MTVSQVLTEPQNRPGENGTQPAESIDPADSFVYPVTGSISARITPEKNGSTITVLQKDLPVYSRVCRTYPWDSTQIQGEIINASFPKLDPDRHPDKDRYKTAFLNLFGRIKRDIAANPLMKRMLSDTLVEDLITSTESVVAYPGENTTALYEKHLNEFMKVRMQPVNSDRKSGTTGEISLLLSGAFIRARKRNKG